MTKEEEGFILANTGNPPRMYEWAWWSMPKGRVYPPNFYGMSLYLSRHKKDFKKFLADHGLEATWYEKDYLKNNESTRKTRFNKADIPGEREDSDGGRQEDL